MSTNELFYSLVPRVYRNRDYDQGQPLRAYLLVLQEQFDRLSTNFAETYDNWFIETCAPWVIPYIAEIIGGSDLVNDQSAVARTRALVANMIGYRRRKGTTIALKNAVADFTGAPTLAVEGIEIVAFTQNVRATQPGRGGLVDVRRGRELEMLRTPFDRLSRTVDVRVPQPGTDRAPRPGLVAALPRAVTLYLWRLPSFPMHGAEPRHVAERRYTFDPSGRDVPLFWPPIDELATGASRDPKSYPDPIRRSVLACEIAAARRLAAGEEAPSLGFAVALAAEGCPPGCFESIPPAVMQAADLSDWNHPKLVFCDDDAPSALPTWILVDPELGRFVLTPAAPPLAEPANTAPNILVDYAYAFSADIGAGPFPRSDTVIPAEGEFSAWVGRFLDKGRDGDERRFRSLRQAVDAWIRSGKNGCITIVDNSIYTLGRSFDLPLSGRRLVIQAGSGCRPLLRGVLDVDATATGGNLTLSGLLVEGAIRSSPQVVLSLATTTLIPGTGARWGEDAPVSLLVPDPEDPLQPIAGALLIDRSITGPLRVSAALDRMHAAASILDGRGGLALSGPDGGFGPRATLEQLTILGAARVAELTWGTDLLLTHPIHVQRETPGYIQYSWVPAGSRVPLAYHIYPADHRRSPAPRFTSVDYGAPGYAQLALVSPEETLHGSALGDQLGAFTLRAQGDLGPRARALIDQFVRIGFEAGVIFAT